MDKEVLTMNKYTVKTLDNTYFVYTSLEKDFGEDFLNFYINLKNYAFISHIIGLRKEDFKSEKEIQDFINENIIDWIYDYKLDLEKLERLD